MNEEAWASKVSSKKVRIQRILDQVLLRDKF